MERRTVSLRIAGQIYKVVTTAPDSELHQLASVVDGKLAEVAPRGGHVPPQAMLLAAMALAHELEEERSKRRELEERARGLMRRVLGRLDDALETSDKARSAD